MFNFNNLKLIEKRILTATISARWISDPQRSTVNYSSGIEWILLWGNLFQLQRQEQQDSEGSLRSTLLYSVPRS